MIKDLTQEQRAVLDEVVAFAKNYSGYVSLDMIDKKMTYDFDNGKGSSEQLLNSHLPELISTEGLTEKQIENLNFW